MKNDQAGWLYSLIQSSNTYLIPPQAREHILAELHGVIQVVLQ